MRYFQKYILSFILNITTYNQTTNFFFFFFWESIKLINRFSYSITTHFIFSNKDYDSCYNPHSVYQTCFEEIRISFRNEDKRGNIKNIRVIFWIQLMDFNIVKLQESYCNLFWKSRKIFVGGTIGNKGEVNVISLNFGKGKFFSALINKRYDKYVKLMSIIKHNCSLNILTH